MKKLRLLWSILKTTGADKIMTGFVGFVLLAALVFRTVEPGVSSYGDGLWYAFAVFTTIGFGDLIAVTAIGRTLTVILGLYGIFVVALIPGVVVSYYTEMSRMRANASIADFLDKLERLPSLSPGELEELSQAVRRRKNYI